MPLMVVVGVVVVVVVNDGGGSSGGGDDFADENDINIFDPELVEVKEM